jgi:nitroreductase
MERNPTLDILMARKSVRVYEARPVSEEIKSAVIAAALRAPTAGNMMLYSIIDVVDDELKTALSHSCDEQPFIATAPIVLVFLADFQRWLDLFAVSGALEAGGPRPRESDFLLAFSDALIAAQTAVVAAESLGLGSCYIGDIMERYEYHRDLFGLPLYAFPAAMVVFGWPTEQQRARRQPERFDRRFIVHENRYRRPDEADYPELYRGRDWGPFLADAANYGQHEYRRKFATAFSEEMRRSVALALENWR